MGFFRMSFYGAAIYLFFLMAFPDWDKSGRHLVVLALIIGAALGIHIFLNAVRTATLIGSILFDLAFAGAVCYYLAWRLPTQSGKPPIQQWAEGHRPTRKTAREGLSRLKLNPDSGPAQLLIALFPKG